MLGCDLCEIDYYWLKFVCVLCDDDVDLEMVVLGEGYIVVMLLKFECMYD